MADRQATDDGSAVIIRPPVGFFAVALASALLMTGIGTLGFIRAGEFRVLPMILSLIGLFLLAVVLLDIPLEVELDKDGVHRRCPLRHQVLEWDGVMAFTRSTPGGVRRFFNDKRQEKRTKSQGPPGSDGQDGPKPTKGGLLVEDVKRRRILLSMARERPDEYAHLVDVVNQFAPGMPMPGPPLYDRHSGRL